MARIEIGDYVIQSDTHNFTLYEKKVVKDGDNAGTDVLRNPGYYATLGNALIGLLQRELKDDTITTVNSVMAKLDAVMAVLLEVGSKVEKDSDISLRVDGRGGEDDDEATGGNDNLYLLPGRARELIPDLKVLDERAKGRGVTLVCEIADVDGAITVVREKIKGAEGPIVQVGRRILEVLGA
jgi:hypothetical protein